VKKLSLIALTAMFATMGLTACPYNNPRVTNVAPKDPVIPPDQKVTQPDPPPPPRKHETYTQGADRPIVYDPKADILFVVDTSDSMNCDQAKLKANIAKFTQGFLAKQGRFLDFHIGVVAVWDSVLYARAMQPGAKYPRKCLNGQLHPVGGGECNPSTLGKANFVTKDTPNLEATLGKTIFLGIEAYQSLDALGAHPTEDQLDKRSGTSGPQDEELFSPVLAALSQQGTQMNPGFRRPDAPLSVIFITDTDDSTPNMDSQNFVELLKQYTGSDSTVTTYAVLARYDDLVKNLTQGVPLAPYTVGDMKSCSSKNGKVDPLIAVAGGAPHKMYDVLQATRNNATIQTGFDIDDDNYGTKLASIGANITKQSLKLRIVLDKPRNVIDPMVVKYGTQVIPQDDVKGWSFNVTQDGTGIVTLNDGVEFQDQKDAKITITYTVGD